MNPLSWLKPAALVISLCAYHASVRAEAAEPATEVAVHSGSIVKTTLRRYVTAYGTVEPEPAAGGKAPAGSKVAAPVAGVIAQVLVEEGQRVEKGAALFALDSRAADALVAKAEVAVDFARKNLARKQQLRPSEDVSRKLYDEAEQQLQAARKDLAQAQTQRALLRIDAPLAGTVAGLYAKVGEAVSLNSVLVDLIDLERLVAAVHVPSQEAAALRLGQPLAVSAGSSYTGSNALPQATLSFISPLVDPRSDTVLVRAKLNTGSGLRPGQFVGVRIVVEQLPERLAVPVASVVNRGGASAIAVVEGDMAKQIPVRLGLRDGDWIEVSGEGLREGMAVVTQGAYGLPAQTRIRVEP